MPSDRPSILFAGGGTGGHLYPAVAIAEQLARLRPRAEIRFLLSNRAIDRQIMEPRPWPWTQQAVRPVSAKPWRWPGFLWAWRRSVRQVRRLLEAHRPFVVVGTGGFAAGPAVYVAHRSGVPTAMLNPDAKPGRANRWLADRADAVFLQWEGSARYFGQHPLLRALGCPVRSAFLNADRSAGVARFELDPDKQTLLVTGASQGARTINEAMIELAAELAGNDCWQVLHLSGQGDHDRVREAYADRLPSARVLAFTEDMPEALAAADLVVARAGASTLAEITAVGRPSVLLPYPFHRDMHQRANAQELARGAAAVIVDDAVDATENARRLGPVLAELMSYPEKLKRMAAAAKAIGRPDAAADIAQTLLEMVGEDGTSR